MLRLSRYTIVNGDRVELGGQLSNIELPRVMLRLSRYTIFNGDGVGLGGQLSNI